MKKYPILIIVSFFFFSLTGCYKRYSRTITVCDGIFFVEKYSHTFIDVAYYYLTDSTNFRRYVGKFDNEHGGYSFKCQTDSLTIFETYEGRIVNTKRYSLNDLRKGK